jgi:hypothetical protein
VICRSNGLFFVLYLVWSTYMRWSDYITIFPVCCAVLSKESHRIAPKGVFTIIVECAQFTSMSSDSTIELGTDCGMSHDQILAQNVKRPDFKCLSQGPKIDKVILIEDNTFLDQLNAAKPIIQWDFRLLGWHSCIRFSKVTTIPECHARQVSQTLKTIVVIHSFASWGISSKKLVLKWMHDDDFATYSWLSSMNVWDWQFGWVTLLHSSCTW